MANLGLSCLLEHTSVQSEMIERLGSNRAKDANIAVNETFIAMHKGSLTTHQALVNTEPPAYRQAARSRHRAQDQH